MALAGPQRVCILDALYEQNLNRPSLSPAIMFSSFYGKNGVIASSPSGRGYLAFPQAAGAPLTSEQKLKLDRDFRQAQQEEQLKKARERKAAEEEAERKREAHQRAWAEYESRQAERRRVVEERDRAEALIGEKHWVRQGGMLRDKDGRRDYARTEEVKKLVEREDRERAIVARWMNHEQAWTALLSSSTPLTFADIPWPLMDKPSDPSELRDVAKIGAFLFESLTVEGNATTRKERLRSSLLRWHPDKLGAVVARVNEEDMEAVTDGIELVVMALMKLQEDEKSQ